MESFFSTLKSERTSRKNNQSHDEARADLFDYVERLYKPKRRHSTLGYLSPVDYEKMARSPESASLISAIRICDWFISALARSLRTNLQTQTVRNL